MNCIRNQVSGGEPCRLRSFSIAVSSLAVPSYVAKRQNGRSRRLSLRCRFPASVNEPQREFSLVLFASNTAFAVALSAMPNEGSALAEQLALERLQASLQMLFA